MSGSKFSRAALGALTVALISAPAIATPPPGWTAHPPLHVRPNASSGPQGFTATQIRTAYGITGDGAGQTIAIVDAYDCPTAYSDLNTFSTTMGLPTLADGSTSTSVSPWFKKITPGGNVRTDSGWALEISLDVQWAHALAPKANILLVEAKSNSFSNLMSAEDTAVKNGAKVVSNSWGGSEFSSESSYDSHFSANGVTFTVSSGDNGTPAEYPSASPNVISVGGTTLKTTSGGAWSSETGWSGSGGGTSAYEGAPLFQTNVGLQYNGRSTPDVSLDADPNTGVSVYDTTGYQGQKGWFVVGGTSASSPMFAGIIAVANSQRVANKKSTLGASATTDLYNLYSSSYASDYHDITSGNNGVSAVKGYDQVTGIGSPIGGGLVPALVSAP